MSCSLQELRRGCARSAAEALEEPGAETPRASQNRKLVTVTATTKRWCEDLRAPASSRLAGCGAPTRCGATSSATATSAHSGDARNTSRARPPAVASDGGEPPDLAWRQRSPPACRAARAAGRGTVPARTRRSRRCPRTVPGATRSPGRAGRSPRPAEGEAVPVTMLASSVKAVRSKPSCGAQASCSWLPWSCAAVATCRRRRLLLEDLGRRISGTVPNCWARVGPPGVGITLRLMQRDIVTVERFYTDNASRCN